jgi:signal transduction histidine kinase
MEGEQITQNPNEKIKQLEEKLAETEQKLNELNHNLEQRVLDRTVEVNKLLRHKTKFIDSLSHDLGTPLTPLVTLLPIVKENTKDPKMAELIDTCIRNAEYIKRVVNNTRKLAEISSTDLLLKKENLFDAIEELKIKYEVVFKSFGIEVKNEIEKEVFVKTEKPKLTEILDQLTSNAVYSMPDGGKLTFESRYVEKENGPFIQISITDTGIGLTRDESDHIFEEFYKIDESRHKLDSTGLGLSICKNIVEKHGGKIWSDSHGKGTGTTIHFTIPSSEFKATRTF